MDRNEMLERELESARGYQTCLDVHTNRVRQRQPNTHAHIDTDKYENVEPDRNALLIRLSESEFAALDLHLYLNTHPCDTEALNRYNQLVMESKMLREEYEAHFGSIFSYISLSDENYFSWIDEPWPWDKTFIGQSPKNNHDR